jgi:ubiquinone biosynthesis protein UbiJ
VSFFLFPQLITSMLEVAVNKLSTLDPTFTQRSTPLVGKRLLVVVDEAKVPLIFVVGETRINVLSGKREAADDNNDCAIKTSLAALKELKDPNQITRLIKQEELSLSGDLQVAQQFSQLLKETDIDWEEHLSEYIGDGLAHKVVSRFRHFSTIFDSKNQEFSRIITEFAQDEARLTPHPVEVKAFHSKISQTRAEADRLAARVASLSDKVR